MTATRKITVELPEETAREIDAKVASGFSETAEAYVVESVESYLLGQNLDVATWVREQVWSAYDAWKSGEEPGIPAEEVFAGVQARHLGRKAAS
jgi:Arc/MetJ-type ribon-helix-helix transcriptional regulator